MSGFVLGIAAAWLTRNPKDSDWHVLFIASLPFVGIVLVTLLINAIRAPVKLDNRRAFRSKLLRESSHRRIADQENSHRKEIDDVNRSTAALLQKPKRTAAEERHYQTAKALLEKYGENVAIVLRFLRQTGAIIHHPSMIVIGPTGFTQDQTMEALLSLWAEHVVIRTPKSLPGAMGIQYTYEIAPGLVAALDELLYSTQT